MSRITTRSIRNSARACKTERPATRIVVLPKPRKSWLLAGTALVTGALAGWLGLSGQALADCGVITAGQSFECDGFAPQSNGFAFTTTDPWYGELVGTGDPAPAAAMTGQLLINNDDDNSGTLDIEDGASINTTSNPNHALVVRNQSPADSTVNVNIWGDLTAPNFYDAFRVENGWTVNTLVGANSTITGGPNGGGNAIVVNAIENHFDLTITNGAVVSSGDVTVLVAQGAVFDSLVNGSVTITTDGALSNTLNRDVIHVDAEGPINVTNGLNGTLTGGTGIDVHGNDVINVTNWNTIIANNGSGGEGGITFQNDSTETTTIRNLSTATIDAAGDGIAGTGNGGDIVIYNGDNSDNTPPFPDNPDGRIIAEQNGIWTENFNGGNITVYNGLKTNSNSSIEAGGEYGIYARSRADGTDDGDGNVNVWNFGYIEVWDSDADAGVYARTSADIDGYAAVYNGAALFSMYEPFSIDARINAYGLETNEIADTSIWDANGIEVVKYGGFHTDGDGGQFFTFDQIFGQGYLAGLELEFGDAYEYLFGELPAALTGLTFSTFTKNYGTWDFTGLDDYLTPGYFGDGEGPVLFAGAQTTGGVFAPGGSAWLARNYSNASTGLWNYGTMIGQGSSGDPVLDIQTVHDDQGANSDTIGGEGETFNFPNVLYIYNAGYQEHTVYDAYYTPWTYATYGVIGSEATPHAWGFDPQYAFQTNFGFQAAGGVDWDFINNTLIDGGELARFGSAANDQLIDASGPNDDGAGMFLFNQGLLIGQIDVDSADGVGNIFLNTGTWITRGTSRFFGEDDILVNFGLVQASQIGEFNSDTEFRSLNETYNYGVFSLLDGGAGDELEFGGDYYGVGVVSALDGYPAYFALDAYLASAASGDADGDLFDIDDYLGGSTGLIVRNANPDGSTGINQEGIDVVEYGSVGGGGCSDFFDAVCKEGDTIYISSLSPNYFEAGGVGMIEDGLYAWSLWHDGDWGDFELRSDWGPGAVNAPGVITGAQTIFYESDSVVADHIYGGQFAGSGGGGADLITDYPATDYAAPASSRGTRSALWAKGFGSWTDRDATVDVGFGPVDTSSNQDIYGILGGGDFKPGGADSPVRVGLYGGYVTSSLDFDLGTDSSVDYDGGTVGGYAAYNNGGFYVDVTVKGDLLDTTYKYSGTSVDADVTNVGVIANTGYRMTMGAGFIEPIASLTYVHTRVDDVTTPGGSVNFSNGESLRAGAGGRIGATFATGGGTTELSLLGKVWNEFEGDNTVTVSDGINTETFTEDTSGVFGEVSAEAVVKSADGSLSGFVSGGGKFGEDFTSWNAKVGVRKGF